MAGFSMADSEALHTFDDLGRDIFVKARGAQRFGADGDGGGVGLAAPAEAIVDGDIVTSCLRWPGHVVDPTTLEAGRYTY